MIAPTVGINPLDPMFLIKLILITAIASFRIAGVGGGATFAALTVLHNDLWAFMPFIKHPKTITTLNQQDSELL